MAINLRFWAWRPLMLISRTRYWVWEKLNPDKPWMCPGTLRFCSRNLDKSMRGIEFGSGRSTSWFASRLANLISVEHHPIWYQNVVEQLASRQITNVDSRLIQLDHPLTEREREVYDPVPAYVRIVDECPDGSLDLVIVDGHYRTHCVRRSLPKIKPGGFLLVDDANLWPSLDSLPIPGNWIVVDDSTNGIKRCVIWKAPSASQS